MVDGNAFGFYRFHQVQQLVHSVQVGRGLRDLRADVAVDAAHGQARQAGRPLVHLQGAFVGNAELVAFETGGNVGVRLRVHVRVDADADRRYPPAGKCHAVEHFQFGFALDVEAQNACLQRLAHFGLRFADTRKNHLGRVAPGGHDTVQLPPRNNVKTTPLARKKLQYCQRGIGFHGVANVQLATGKPAPVGLQGLLHGSLRIHKQRRAVLLRQKLQADAFHPQRTLAVVDVGVTRQSRRNHGVVAGTGTGTGERASTGTEGWSATTAGRGPGAAVEGSEGIADPGAGRAPEAASPGGGVGRVVKGAGTAGGVNMAPGRSVWGSVARAVPGPSPGRNSGPRWPQPAAASTASPARLAARAKRLARIWKTLNMGKL